MTEILLPEPEDDPKKRFEKFDTEKDEQQFFLMYHMNVQPSEAQALDDDYREWLVHRFIAQKNMEREAMQRHQLMSQIGPDLKGGLRVDS